MLSFDELYERICFELDSKIESKRLVILCVLVGYTAIFVYLLVKMVMIMLKIKKSIFNIVNSGLILLLIAFILGVFIFKVLYKNYNKIYKFNILKRIAESNGFNYYNNVGMYSETYNLANYKVLTLGDNKIDKLVSNDLIELDNDDCKIKFSKVNAYISTINTYEYGRNIFSTKNISKSYTGVFYGYVGIIEFENSLDVDIIISNQKKSFLESFINKKVKINDEFDKKFSVYTKDKDLIFKFINNNFMDFLMKFSNKLNLPFEIKIYKNVIGIRFFNGSVLEAPILSSIKSESYLKKQFDILEFMRKIEYYFKEIYKVNNL